MNRHMSSLTSPTRTACPNKSFSMEWSYTYLNYYQDSAQPPPDSTNSDLSEHEIRKARRGEDSPNIIRKAVRIRNIQGHESQFTLTEQGFTIGHLASRMQDWRDEAELKRVYFAEVSELLKRETGAKHVFSYEHHIRTGDLEEALEVESSGAVDINGPVRRVHIGESPASAINEYNYYLKPNDPGNEHLKDRPFGIYNVWKPLKTIRKDPLCLCDARTIKDEDLHGTKVTVPNVNEIENFSVRPPRDEGAHSFVYVRDQRPEQALVFRIYDGRIDGVVHGKRSHGVAHSSFVDPGTEKDSPRESVEVRSFCTF